MVAQSTGNCPSVAHRRAGGLCSACATWPSCYSAVTRIAATDKRFRTVGVCRRCRLSDTGREAILLEHCLIIVDGHRKIRLRLSCHTDVRLMHVTFVHRLLANLSSIWLPFRTCMAYRTNATRRAMAFNGPKKPRKRNELLSTLSEYDLVDTPRLALRSTAGRGQDRSPFIFVC